MRVRQWTALVALGICAGCASSETSAPSSQPRTTTASAPAKSPEAKSPETLLPGSVPLFDGKTLAGWRISDFAGSGPVRVEDGSLILEMGTMTGVTYTNPVPTMNYEISVDAMRVDGNDFFCGLTFPVGNDPCSLIVGGWGGGVVGLSSLDGQDASSNETTQYMNFEKERWYKVRLRVVPNKIQAWVDDERIIDVDTTDRKISVRLEVEESRPLGFATWSTTAALRNIRLRKLN
jgi:hypothetical protein